MRATLNQGTGALLNFTAYFTLGIPISLFFAFKQDMGIKGIWIGPAFAVICLTFSYNLVIMRIDWSKLIASIKERRRAEN